MPSIYHLLAQLSAYYYKRMKKENLYMPTSTNGFGSELDELDEKTIAALKKSAIAKAAGAKNNVADCSRGRGRGRRSGGRGATTARGGSSVAEL